MKNIDDDELKSEVKPVIYLMMMRKKEKIIYFRTIT